MHPSLFKMLYIRAELGVDRLSAPILSILPIIDIGHFKNRFADNFFFFFFFFFMQTNILQGSRVRPIWSHVHPNFSRVRLTKIPGRTGASSHSRKEKKSIRDSETLCGSTKDTPVRLISWSKPIRDSEGRTPPLIGRGPDIPVCVCARCQMRHVCCCNQTERKRWVVEMRAVLPT